ncbi:MAG: hypothetical protein COA42_12150 [Alteromonadaceae bacterium]|nr:MAG: hypothetical protein COA42_12150 [Alteromonadaceae bacterium]
MASNSINQYRYERKFVAETESFCELEHMVRNLPGFFTTLHPPRRINNLYFDSHDLDDFMATVNGEKKRHKVRLRWYGETYSANVDSPQLEIKIKLDQANTKKIAVFEKGDSTNLPEWLSQITDPSLVPSDMHESLVLRKPTLINTYYRHYFGSVDGKFRLTVDQDISYQAVTHTGEPISELIREENHSVIELKYDIGDHQGLPTIASAMPYRLSRNSKYRNGITCLMEHGYI